MTDQNPTQQKTRRNRRAPKFTKTRPAPETVDTNHRIFLAVPVPPEVRELVGRTVESLKREDWPVRWTSGANAHLTLHFLGEIEPERVPILRMALRQPVAEHQPFDLRTADLGVFPKMKRPRVLWIGLYGPAHRLDTLHQAVGAVLEELDFELDEKEFHPHITLGRVRDPRFAKVRDLPGAIRTRFEQAAETGEVSHKHPIPFPVTEVQLIRSHLGKDGARYEIVDRFPLAEREPDQS